MHRAQGEADAPAPAQDVHEERGRVPRPAQLAVHQGEALADREGQLVRERHPLGLRGRERLQEPVAAGQERLRLRAQAAVPHLEVAGGPPLRERGEEPAGGLFRRAAEHAAEDPVQVGRAPVVVAHEQLRGEEAAAVLVAERLRHRGLQVEGQHVRLAAGEEVRLRAHAEEEVVGAQGRLVLPLGEEPRLAGLGEARGRRGAPGPPTAPRGGRAGPPTPSFTFGSWTHTAPPTRAWRSATSERSESEEGLARLAVAPDHVVECPVERAEHRRVAGHEARLGERGAGDDVAAGLLEALAAGSGSCVRPSGRRPRGAAAPAPRSGAPPPPRGPGAGTAGPRPRTARAPRARSRRAPPPRTRRGPAAPRRPPRRARAGRRGPPPGPPGSCGRRRSRGRPGRSGGASAGGRSRA